MSVEMNNVWIQISDNLVREIMASEEPLLFPGEELLMFQSKNRNIFLRLMFDRLREY